MCARYTKTGQVRKKPISASTRAGLTFSVSKIQRKLRIRCARRQRIQKASVVYMAAVLQYLVAEIIELGGNAARIFKKVRITPRHLMLGVRRDEELNTLLKNVTIPEAGVVPEIQTELLPKKITKSKSNESVDDY